MTTQSESPFVPGARVAVEIRHRFSGTLSYCEGHVEKVYKNGNFVLRGSTEQWRSCPPGRYEDAAWEGHRTGGSYGRLVIWNAETDAKIAAAIEIDELRKRREKAVAALTALKQPQLDGGWLTAIETAIKGMQSKETE